MLAKTFGCCRYVYNWALEQNEKAFNETGKNVSRIEMQKKVIYELREVSAPWMREVSSQAIAFAVLDLYNAYDLFFKGLNGFPQKRSKYHRQHYHDRAHSPKAIKVDYEKGLITIPKIKDIPCVFHRRFNGRIKQISVELVPSGKYNISLLVEDGLDNPAAPDIELDNALGIDTGLERFATLSDGQIYEPTHYARQERRKLKLLSRQLEKKQIGSRQFCIYKKRIAKLHEHIANKRNDHVHKITHYLAYENQATTICVENLNIEGMMHNKHLAYNVNDAGLGAFYRQLEYKCRLAGKNYIKIDRWAPSSRTCSNCGHIYKTLTMDEREWMCPKCGMHHDRDLNAAINIKHFGLSEQKTLPAGRGEVTPVEQPLVDDRSSEPKKLRWRKSARRVREEKRQSRCDTDRRVREDETGKEKGDTRKP